MGHIVNSFGVYGWVKVCPYTEFIDGLLNYPVWWLSNKNNDWQEVRLISGYVSGSILHAKFKECTDRTQALKLRGMQIAIPRNQLPALTEKEDYSYYWSDLIGTHVINLNNEELGEVVGLLETGANDVLRVYGERKKEILIPFIKQVIIKVDPKQSKIIVDWGVDY